MGEKENRPVACAASGTASTCDYDSTSVSAGQDMTENELIRTVTENYLAGIDMDDRPAPEQVERELLQATNNAIEAYNLGPRDPSAPVGAKQNDAYTDQKKGDARLRLRKHLDPYQIALVVRELHHAVGILWKDAGDDGNFDIGVYQTSGDNEGTYDVSEDGLTRLIRSYDSAMRMRKAVFKHSRAKIVYVMNGWNRFKASRDFMEWFEGLAGDQTVVTLPQSEAFVQAGAAGVSVVEFDRRGKAARATRALVDTVREAAGFPRE